MLTDRSRCNQNKQDIARLQYSRLALATVLLNHRQTDATRAHTTALLEEDTALIIYNNRLIS